MIALFVARAYVARLLRRAADVLAPVPTLPMRELALEPIPDDAVAVLVEAGRLCAAAEVHLRAQGYDGCGCRRCGIAAEVLRDAAHAMHRGAVRGVSAVAVGRA